MKIPISKLLVNRSSLTREFGINGAAIKQMATHIPMFRAIVGDVVSGWRRWGKYSYNSVLDASLPGTKRQKTEKYLTRLIRSIETNGIKDPLTGWSLNNDGFVELLGGHHRAVIAAELGHLEIEVDLRPLDMFFGMPKVDVDKVRSVYGKVKNTENLRAEQSYNPMPGMRSIRQGQWRLEKIYREIITCHGDRLLDAGCNDGFFGCNLLLHDFDVTFLDRSKPYLDVCSAKVDALGEKKQDKKAVFVHSDIDSYFGNNCNARFDVVLYLDVFYHTVLEKGVATGIRQLQNVINRTEETLIIAPGRWDKLEAAGCTERMVYDVLREKAKQIKYIGADNDPHYHRDIYAVKY